MATLPNVPSNLIPLKLSQLPNAPTASEDGLLMYVYQGNTYKIRAGDLLNVAGVPPSRQVIAGTGLQGGGQLTENVTLSVAPGGIDTALLADSGVTPGVYGSSSTIPVLTIDQTGRVMAATTAAAAGSGTVTSVAATVPTGFEVSGSPITTSGTLAFDYAVGYSLPTTVSQYEWDAAYADRFKWDGGDTGLVATTGRTSLGASVLGSNLFTITDPNEITFPRFNADNTVSSLGAADFRTAIGAGTGSGTVTSVAASLPTGMRVTGSPITGAGTLAIDYAVGYSLPTTASQTNWDTAYADRLKWDGGATGLTASTGRTSLGATTLGGNLFTLTNPSAVTFPRFNADNTVSALDAADFRTAIGVSPSAGTVTSVSGAGTVNGITLTGTVTTSGSLTLGGTLSGVSLSTQVTDTLPVANGGTGATTLTGYVKGSGTAALTAASTIPNTDITGLGTMSTQAASSVAITGGSINATTIGAVTPAAATFTSAALTTGTVATTPVTGTDIANKSYVDTIAAAGIHYHTPVFVESPSTVGNLNAVYNQPGGAGVGVGATLTNNGTKAALVIDGVLMTTTKRVLIYNQTNAFENGVYTVTTVGTPDPGGTNWVLTRATDADTYAPSNPNSLGQGDAFFVTSGDTGAGEGYVCTTVGVITFGTTAITFSQFSASVAYSAGTGLNLNPATTFNISDVGTAGTYGSASAVPVFVTNAQGQVTGVTNTAIAIANTAVSGLGTMSTQDASAVAITGGAIDGVAIGATTASTGKFTTLTATGGISGGTF